MAGVPSKAEAQALVLKLGGLIAGGGLEECPICMEDVADAIITSCGHVFCRDCIENWLLNNVADCPMCRSRITRAGLFSAPQEGSGSGDGDGAPCAVRAAAILLPR